MQLRPRPLRPPSSQLRVLGPLEVQRQASNKRRMLRKRRERKLEQVQPREEIYSEKTWTETRPLEMTAQAEPHEVSASELLCSPYEHSNPNFFLPTDVSTFSDIPFYEMQPELQQFLFTPYTSSNVSTLNDFPLAGDPFYDFSPAFMPSESSALMAEPSAPPSKAFFMSAQQVAESSTALMEEPFTPPSTSFFMPAQYSAKPGALIAEPFSPPSTTFLTPAQRLESNQQHPNEWLDSARDSSVIGRQRTAPDEKEVFLVKKKKMLNEHIHSVQRPNAEIYSTNEAYDSLFQHHPPTLQTQSIHVGIAYYRREAIFRADGILGPIVDGQILSCKGYLDGNWEVVFRLITTQTGRDLLCLHNYSTQKAAILSVHNRDYWGKVDNADELMVTQMVF
ncbi:hypothetical protein C8F04DRAFT_1181779 [Mycena alexandri]|uniref:Uncharacterized protein n=1 Tax=Mycena alexandri TaxID=1745969 RepID=A0AAD6SXR3_9AGAR|nr:hypothetical protein C8F04DRAFT_1181779 [Mycena alexandri]